MEIHSPSQSEKNAGAATIIRSILIGTAALAAVGGGLTYLAHRRAASPSAATPTNTATTPSIPLSVKDCINVSDSDRQYVGFAAAGGETFTIKPSISKQGEKIRIAYTPTRSPDVVEGTNRDNDRHAYEYRSYGGLQFSIGQGSPYDVKNAANFSPSASKAKKIADLDGGGITIVDWGPKTGYLAQFGNGSRLGDVSIASVEQMAKPGYWPAINGVPGATLKAGTEFWVTFTANAAFRDNWLDVVGDGGWGGSSDNAIGSDLKLSLASPADSSNISAMARSFFYQASNGKEVKPFPTDISLPANGSAAAVAVSPESSNPITINQSHPEVTFTATAGRDGLMVTSIISKDATGTVNGYVDDPTSGGRCVHAGETVAWEVKPLHLPETVTLNTHLTDVNGGLSDASADQAVLSAEKLRVDVSGKVAVDDPSQTAQITAMVTDENGQAIPNENVTIAGFYNEGLKSQFPIFEFQPSGLNTFHDTASVRTGPNGQAVFMMRAKKQSAVLAITVKQVGVTVMTQNGTTQQASVPLSGAL